MSARDSILGRIRRATGGGDPTAVAARTGQPAPVPAAARTGGEARIDQFIAKAKAVDATVSRLASLDELPRALAEELRARARGDPDGRGPGIRARLGRDRAHHRPRPARARRSRQLAMAETGTLLLASGAENPVTLTFLGETHFVVLNAEDVRAGFEDMWAEWRQSGLDPRTVNLVTGPSRSADIGQTLQLGAHGPVALHIFVVG